MVSNFTSAVVLLVLMLVAGHVKVIFGVEENESASAGHYPDYDGTHSKRYGFSASSAKPGFQGLRTLKFGRYGLL